MIRDVEERELRVEKNEIRSPVSCGNYFLLTYLLRAISCASNSPDGKEGRAAKMEHLALSLGGFLPRSIYTFWRRVEACGKVAFPLINGLCERRILFLHCILSILARDSRSGLV